MAITSLVLGILCTMALFDDSKLSKDDLIGMGLLLVGGLPRIQFIFGPQNDCHDAIFAIGASAVTGNVNTPAIVKPTGVLLMTLSKPEPGYCVNLAGISGGLTVRNSGVFDTHTSKPRKSGLFCALSRTRSLAIRPWQFSCFLGHVQKVGNRPYKQTKPELTLNEKANHEEIDHL